jgi:DNA mismatch repair protein MutH
LIGSAFKQSATPTTKQRVPAKQNWRVVIDLRVIGYVSRRVARNRNHLEIQTDKAHGAAICLPLNGLRHGLSLGSVYLCTGCVAQGIYATGVVVMVMRD